jgi:ubiquinone/menaquinone biosynthesis C-methylase UbiE
MNTANWILNELAHAGIEHVDADYVTTYDLKAGTDPSADVKRLCELGLNETHTIVDLGAGTGTFALAAAPHCRQVVAVDVSAAMLSMLYEKAVRLGIKNIQCVQAGFLSYEHQGEPADFVYTRNAIHHLPDLWKAIALKRIAAMMPVGGVLRLRDFIFSFGVGETEDHVEAWLAGATADPELGWTREELETHMREEYSTYRWLFEPMLEKAGFEILDAQPIASRVYTSYTCVKLH